MQNKGQADSRALYYVQQPTWQAYLEKDGIQFFFFELSHMREVMQHPASFWSSAKPAHIAGHAIRMRFAGATTTAIQAERPKEGLHHFFHKNIQATGCRTFEQVVQKNVYAGVDAIWQITADGSMKYDLYVAPFTSLKTVQISYEGAQAVRIRPDGSLAIQTSVGEYREQAPVAYQIVSGKRKEVRCKFVLDSATHMVSFSVETYHSELPLIIDPELLFSTYSGSTVDNFGATATYDANGNFYAAGITTGPLSGYPATAGAFDMTYNGGLASWPQFSFSCDITISKYTNDGSALIYATYLGGSRNDYVHSLVASPNGELLVMGTTLSSDFPVSSLGYDTSFNDTFDLVITRLHANGSSLIGSTYLGGSGIDGISVPDTLCMNYMDQMRGEIQLAPNGDVLIASVTSSANFPATSGVFQSSYQGRQDGCVARFSPSLHQLLWCSFIGGPNHETVNGLELLPSGELLLTGGTQSAGIPAVGKVADSTYNGGVSDAWIAQVKPTGDSLHRFLYWGTADYDQIYAIRASREGKVYVLGQTFGIMPTTTGVYKNDSGTLFISCFSANLDSLYFSTVIGNGVLKNVLSPSAFMVDYCGTVYASVWAGSVNTSSVYKSGAWWLGGVSSTLGLDTISTSLQKSTDGEDFYLFVLSTDLDSLLYATFLGEFGEGDHVDGGTSRFDSRGIIYQSVCASCGSGTFGNFPTTPGSFSPTNRSNRCSNASVKLDFRVSGLVTADFIISPALRCADSVITCFNNSFQATNYKWFINDTLADTAQHLVRVFTQPGIYQIKLIAIDSTRCNRVDSLTKQVQIGRGVHAAFTTARDTCTPTLFFYNLSFSSTGDTLPVLWDFGDGTTSTLQNPQKIYAISDNYPVFLYVIDSLGCSDTAFQFADYNRNRHILNALLSPIDTISCEPFNASIFSFGAGGQQFKWFINDTLVTTNRNLDTALFKGSYRFKHIVYDSATCKIVDSGFAFTRIVPEVTPDFTYIRDSCSFTVHFTNTSIRFPSDTVEFIWYFGDGDSAVQFQPSHTYLLPGTYNVSLRVNRGTWCDYTRSMPVPLDDNNLVLRALYTVSPDTLCSPAQALFTNTSVNGFKYYWFVNDTLRDSTRDFSLSGLAEGTYSIQLIAFDTVTCFPSDTIVDSVQVFTPVVPSFSVLRDSCSNAVFFINTTDTTTSGHTDILWDFGDGNTSTDWNPTHVFGSSGLYTITLYTRPGLPCMLQLAQPVNYDNDAHVIEASFTRLDSSFCLPVRLRTQNTSVNNTYTYWWLNDTLISTDTDIDTLLTVKQLYAVKLIVVDSATCATSDTAQLVFDTEQASAAAFEVLSTFCSLDIELVNKSVPIASSLFDWNFGDGNTSNEVQPTHTYKQSGSYDITLISNSGTACADTFSQSVSITGDSIMPLKIANVFTPNDDGKNDCFLVEGVSESCDEFHIWIRNRWGNLFYESTNPDACWNGKNEKGVDAAEGVYYYIVFIKKRNGPVIETNGTVTLIR